MISEAVSVLIFQKWQGEAIPEHIIPSKVWLYGMISNTNKGKSPKYFWSLFLIYKTLKVYSSDQIKQYLIISRFPEI